MTIQCKLFAVSLALFSFDWAGSAAMAAEPESSSPAIPKSLSDEECWRLMPPTEAGGSQPLPSWAKALAGVMPHTTAAMLGLDHAHRVRNPLDPQLRSRMRWAAAHAVRSRYGEAYAEADGHRAGFDAEALASLRRGDWAKLTVPEKEAIEFARKMTVDSASVTDADFASLAKHYGENHVVAMVLLIAYANFQDRLLLSLGCEVEPDGPLPPIAVTFEPGAFNTKPVASVARGKPPQATTATAIEDLIEDDPEWAGTSYERLQARLESQRNRKARVRIPSWDEVKRGFPEGYNPYDRPIRVAWGLVCFGYQPELAAAWNTCTRTFSAEAKPHIDGVFAQSVFWITTRAMDCPYCMGHCEMNWEIAGLSGEDIAMRSRILAGNDWSMFPPGEQRAYDFTRTLTRSPWKLSAHDVSRLKQDLGDQRAVFVIWWACRGHYMTRVSNAFQLGLERDNVFKDYFAK